MKILARITALIVTVVAVLAAVVLARTWRYSATAQADTPVQLAGAPVTPLDTVVDAAAIDRLSQAVQIRTISYFDSSARISEFRKFHVFLEKAFPLVHAKLRREVLDSATLLFTWTGTDTSLAPVLLMGHQDVVPVEPGTEKDWKHDAFSGDVSDGYVWGRGTLDDKISVMGLLEGTESLLKRGVQPRRTLLFAFGHNEEVGGPSAQQTAQLLKSRGIRPLFVMDEGGALGDSLVPGVPRKVALIGISEKGYLSLRLTAHGQGGHSSMPPRETAVSILSEAVSRVQDNPLPARLNDVSMAMFNTLGPLMPTSRRLIFANLWLFEPVLKAGLDRMASGSALIRTSTAATMISGGIKDNVVPSTATAVINFRLMPGDSVAWVVDRVKALIADDRVDVAPIAGMAREASDVSPTDADGYRLIGQTIREVFPGTQVAPYLLMGGTDSRNFYLVTPNVYRFAPIVVKGETLRLAHGTNERVSVENYLLAVRLYRRLIENAIR